MSESGVAKSIEKAPSSPWSASAIASSSVAARERAMRWRTTSVSEVEEKIAPSASSRARASLASGKLPLWQSASWPKLHLTAKGCASLRLTSPAVE